MSKTAAIICEFNPFHSGHLYMIRKIKEELGFEHIVCFMSGNFVQRGEPAIMDKYLRAADAINGGADLVLELPLPFSSGSAGYFARAAVSMVLKSRLCDHLIFGLEAGTDFEQLKHIAESTVSGTAMKELMRKGTRYADAYFMLTGRTKLGSNALLATAYLEALGELDPEHTVTPLGIERKGDEYGRDIPLNERYTSASALRKLLLSGDTSAGSYLPFRHEDTVLCDPDRLSILLNEKLLLPESFVEFWDVPNPLSNHLRKSRYDSFTFRERVEDCLSACYSRSRISRALLHIALGIKKETVEKQISEGYVRYFRVLGYRQSSGLLTKLKVLSDLPIYTKNAGFYQNEPGALYYDQIWHIMTGTKPDHLTSPYIIG